jgi:multidrug efflux system membrane fusion protein
MRDLIAKRPWLVALAITLLLMLWLLGGRIQTAQEQGPEDRQNTPAALPLVQIVWLEASPVARQQVLQGQLEPWKRAELSAQVSGTVTGIERDKGSEVVRGDALLKLSAENRPEQLLREEAEVRQREAAVTAARRLRDSKLISANDLLKVETELANARVRLAAARLALENTQIKAPFAGIVDQRRVELGDFVQPGQNLLTLVDISRLKVVAQIPQQQVAALRLQQPVRVQLLNGGELQGQVHFIAAAADPGTRSFRIEVSVDNPQHQRLAGASATVHIETGETLAHPLSPALISLDQAGRTGVKWVDEQQRVQFSPVQLVSVSNQQAWVSGLPPRVALITLGQGFVEPGQQVQTRVAGEGR